MRRSAATLVFLAMATGANDVALVGDHLLVVDINTGLHVLKLDLAAHAD